MHDRGDLVVLQVPRVDDLRQPGVVGGGKKYAGLTLIVNTSR